MSGWGLSDNLLIIQHAKTMEAVLEPPSAVTDLTIRIIQHSIAYIVKIIP